LVFSLPAAQLQSTLCPSASLTFLKETKAFQIFQMIALIIFNVSISFAMALLDLCMMEDFELYPPVPKIKHNRFWLNSVS